ncbi:MAG: hypothetical protein AAGM67_09805 [Bacteroidota bacterium]
MNLGKPFKVLGSKINKDLDCIQYKLRCHGCGKTLPYEVKNLKKYQEEGVVGFKRGIFCVACDADGYAPVQIPLADGTYIDPADTYTEED